MFDAKDYNVHNIVVCHWMSSMNVECGIHFLGERENDEVSQIYFLESENYKIFQIQDKSIFEGSENDD